MQEHDKVVMRFDCWPCVSGWNGVYLRSDRQLWLGAILNHYDVLGLAKDADPIVIKAAYKVMVQKYHPDKYKGADGLERIVAINSAYEVLCNPEARKRYDESLRFESSEEASYSDDESSGYAYNEADWDYACKYFPDLKVIDRELAALSGAVSGFFRALILETKDFSGARKVARDVELSYLRRYFGVNQRIVEFARELLIGKRIDAARELNKVVNKLGSSIDANLVIHRIDVDFPKVVEFRDDAFEKKTIYDGRDWFFVTVYGVLIFFVIVFMVSSFI